MYLFFTLLFFLSLLLIPVGIIKPSVFFKKSTVSRKKIAGIGALILMLSFGLLVASAPPSTRRPAQEKVASPSAAISQTPQASPSGTTLAHGGVFATVTHVVDGDTIKLESGEVVRYIGMNTPETVDPRRPVECFGKEASAKNKALVEGQTVELEKDVSEKDKYGRLLRYVWLGDTMINELLVREGFAQVSTYPPDVKYKDRFLAAERLAREEKKGLWGSACEVTPTIKPTSVPPTPKPTTSASSQDTLGAETTTAITNTGGTYTCNCSKTCPNMSSCEEAQYQLNVCGCKARDADGDGIACDAQCQ